MVKDQKMEYILRGDDLEDWCYWDYFLETYEKSTPKASEQTTNKGVPYRPGGPTKAVRRVRLPGHEMLPLFVGQWFPSARDENHRELYCACMLALFTPWRTLSTLKDHQETFAERFAKFEETSPAQRLTIMQNMEYYYLSAEAAKVDKPIAQLGPVHRISLAENEEVGFCALTDEFTTSAPLDVPITDEDIEAECQAVYTAADRRFAAQAMALAYNGRVFEDSATPCSPWRSLSRVACETDSAVFDAWSTRLKHYTRGDNDTCPIPLSMDDTAGCDGPEALFTLDAGHLPDIQVDDTCAASNVPTLAVKMELNQEQQRAYDIIKHHLVHSITTGDDTQLLMIVNGPGGTGKSALIEAITDLMASSGVPHWLAKTATSGVAATRIGGTTAHSWAGLGIATKAGMALNASDKTLAKRKVNMQHARYLIVDEFSMLTKGFLESLSEVRPRNSAPALAKVPLGLLPNQVPHWELQPRRFWRIEHHFLW